MEAYSLFELNEHIRRVIALNFQDPLWVRCEISQVRQSRGHYYLELVEKVPDQDEILAQVSAVIWAKTAWLLEKKLKEVFAQIVQDGMEVRLKVRVDFHEKFGMKLMVEDIDPSFTLGHIEARRREIIGILHAEGRIGLNARLPLPVVIQRIAVLSAVHAAGFHDFRKHLLQNRWHFRYWLDLYPVAVQGAMVESEILSALEKISRVTHHYDCVVIIRGGGSRLDLAAFDSLALGRAIADFPLPVFTGIGHEIDTTVADVVAHTSLKTPTAVAGMLLEVNGAYAATVRRLYDDILGVVRARARDRRLRLSHAIDLLRRIPAETVRHHRLILAQIIPAFKASAGQAVQTEKNKMTHLTTLFEALDPSSLLKRGFTITTLDGRRLNSASGIPPGAQLITHFSDGDIHSTVDTHE